MSTTTSTKEGIHIALTYLGSAGYSGIYCTARTPREAIYTLLSTAVQNNQLDAVCREIRRQLLVDINQSDVTTFHISLTPNGAYRLLKENTDKLTIPSMNKWDGKWRLVCFDIPKGKDKERLYLNRRLHELNLTMIQRSMWVHPYDCFEVMKQITDFCSLSRYVTVLEVTNLDNLTERKLLRTYDLNLPPIKI